MPTAPTFRLAMYASDGLLLGLFMAAVGVFAPLVYHPLSPLSPWLPEAWRGAAMGLAMGTTAVALIYSPLGGFCGALMNPATTLAFLRLGRIRPGDSLGYMIAQCLGGVLGCVMIGQLVGPSFTEPPVNYAPTTPGAGAAVAFVTELLMSAAMMLAVLAASNSKRLSRFTGLIAGCLIAAFITIAAPVSGFSINPARTLASAIPSGTYDEIWIYFLAPPIGMLAGAEVFVRAGRHVHCCKLNHGRGHCPHCGCDGPINWDEHTGAAA